ncbi:MAG TPA: flagellar motor protein MotB [Burkholderiales bacterium]|nr:flagellar motor protein MotB [Burkholderiales bacterium]
MYRNLAIAISVAAALAACVSDQTYQAEVKKADTYQALSKQLQAEIKSDQVQIQQLQDRLKVTMVDEILFPEGGWQLSRKGEETLAKIIPTLSGLKNQRIVVEGFTDNVPIGPALKTRFPSNWELSTARATDVVRFLSAKGVPNGVLSAEGFGDSRPVATNDTPQGRAKNRRVDIVITGQSQ